MDPEKRKALQEEYRRKRRELAKLREATQEGSMGLRRQVRIKVK